MIERLLDESRPARGSVSRDEMVSGLQARIRQVLQPMVSAGPLALVDFPDHGNVGDSAIWLGEMAYLAEQAGGLPAYVSSIASYSSLRLAEAVPDGAILIHGGGNFGTIWQHHHRLRLQVLRDFPGRKVIQMPQSIHFENEAGIEETARAIAAHGNFTLLVRDQQSFDLAQTHFDCDIHLCPDMAFYIGPVERRPSDVDILCLMRTDSERAVEGTWPDGGASRVVVDWRAENRWRMRLVRALAKARAGLQRKQSRDVVVYNLLAAQRFHRGVHILSRGRAVITDRLHAHIISLLLDIPHVALDNSYGKVEGFISAWTSRYTGVAQATDRADAATKAECFLV